MLKEQLWCRSLHHKGLDMCPLFAQKNGMVICVWSFRSSRSFRSFRSFRSLLFCWSVVEKIYIAFCYKSVVSPLCVQCAVRGEGGERTVILVMTLSSITLHFLHRKHWQVELDRAHNDYRVVEL